MLPIVLSFPNNHEIATELAVNNQNSDLRYFSIIACS
jgi:hypothetical protein